MQANQLSDSTSSSVSLKSGVSVIICCYNSATRIQKTLQHLALQILDDQIPCEIIVVNNASTDNLDIVVKDTWLSCGSPFPLKVIFEPTPGLAFARRSGVLSASYTYGVFCDDDNWLSPDYLIKVVNIFNTKPQMGLIGGCSTPVLEDTAPAWFYTKSSAFAVGIQAPETGDITHRGFVWGAGMAFRVQVLKSIFEAGIKPLVSGRKGDVLTSGDDGEISAWYIFSGYHIWYDSEMRFQHFIPQTRLSDEYYQRFFQRKYPTPWQTYRKYLTVRYFLVYPRQSIADRATGFARYLLSAVLLLTHPQDILTVIQVERKVKRSLKAY